MYNGDFKHGRRHEDSRASEKEWERRHRPGTCIVRDAIGIKFQARFFFLSFLWCRRTKTERWVCSLGITRKSRPCEREKRKTTHRLCTYAYFSFNTQSIMNSPFMNFVSNLSPIRFGASSLGGNNTVVPICFSSPSAFKRYD